MTEYVLEYLERLDVSISDREEQDKIEEGIRMYLRENGISDEDTGEYYKQYILKHIQIINRNDLKQYFINYPVISEINQIVIEYNHDGALSQKRTAELYSRMSKLYECGLNDKYIPAYEIKQILA